MRLIIGNDFPVYLVIIRINQLVAGLYIVIQRKGFIIYQQIGNSFNGSVGVDCHIVEVLSCNNAVSTHFSLLLPVIVLLSLNPYKH